MNGAHEASLYDSYKLPKAKLEPSVSRPQGPKPLRPPRGTRTAPGLPRIWTAMDATLSPGQKVRTALYPPMWSLPATPRTRCHTLWAPQGSPIGDPRLQGSPQRWCTLRAGTLTAPAGRGASSPGALSPVCSPKPRHAAQSVR